MQIPTTLQQQTDAINRHDPRALAAAYSPTATVFDPTYPEPLRGRPAIEKDMADFVAAFPDLEFHVERVIAEGPTFASEITIRGTHDGPILGPTGLIPPTGKRIEVRMAVHARLDSAGRVAEERRYFDLAGLFAQLGVLQ